MYSDNNLLTGMCACVSLFRLSSFDTSKVETLAELATLQTIGLALQPYLIHFFFSFLLMFASSSNLF